MPSFVVGKLMSIYELHNAAIFYDSNRISKFILLKNMSRLIVTEVPAE